MTPRHVQKDPEASLTWVLKDELVTRGHVYCAKLARGKAMFLAPRIQGQQRRSVYPRDNVEAGTRRASMGAINAACVDRGLRATSKRDGHVAMTRAA